MTFISNAPAFRRALSDHASSDSNNFVAPDHFADIQTSFEAGNTGFMTNYTARNTDARKRRRVGGKCLGRKE